MRCLHFMYYILSNCTFVYHKHDSYGKNLLRWHYIEVSLIQHDLTIFHGKADEQIYRPGHMSVEVYEAYKVVKGCYGSTPGSRSFEITTFGLSGPETIEIHREIYTSLELV